MRFFKPLLFVFCLFLVGANSLKAQKLSLTIDSITHHGVAVTSDTTALQDSVAADSILIYTWLHNTQATAIFLYDTSLSLTASNGGILIPDSLNFVYILPNTILNPGDSAQLILKIQTGTTNPLPNLAPTGSSVVIWPVYDSQAGDSALIWLYAVSPYTAITGVQNIYNNILYNSQFIHIIFTKPAERTLQLFDATGRKVYESESNSANAEIDWSALPEAVYILRIRQGEQNVSVKLVHF